MTAKKVAAIYLRNIDGATRALTGNNLAGIRSKVLADRPGEAATMLALAGYVAWIGPEGHDLDLDTIDRAFAAE